MLLYPYLIALALIEQEGIRAMPLCGKSLKEVIQEDSDPGFQGENLANQLLIRIFQKSEKAPLRRAAGDTSLLFLQIPMEELQGTLPACKADWIRSADTALFLSRLNSICHGIWTLQFNRDDGLKFKRLDCREALI